MNDNDFKEEITSHPVQQDTSSAQTIVLSEENSDRAAEEPEHGDENVVVDPKSLLQKVRERLEELKKKGEPGNQGASILSVRQYLVDAIEESIRPHIRRGVELAASQVVVHILETDAANVQRILAAIDSIEPPFEKAVLERLRSARISLPRDFSCDVIIYTSEPASRSDIFDNSQLFIELRQESVSFQASVTILDGLAEQPAYIVTSDRPATVGRNNHVENERGHLIRTNVIAFIDPESLSTGDPNRPINETVSRIHGRFEFDSKSKRFVYRNERGSTRLLRSSLPSPQPVQPGRTVPLDDGDILYFGSASVEFATRLS